MFKIVWQCATRKKSFFLVWICFCFSSQKYTRDFHSLKFSLFDHSTTLLQPFDQSTIPTVPKKGDVIHDFFKLCGQYTTDFLSPKFTLGKCLIRVLFQQFSKKLMLFTTFKLWGQYTTDFLSLKFKLGKCLVTVLQSFQKKLMLFKTSLNFVGAS